MHLHDELNSVAVTNSLVKPNNKKYCSTIRLQNNYNYNVEPTFCECTLTYKSMSFTYYDCTLLTYCSSHATYNPQLVS